MYSKTASIVAIAGVASAVPLGNVNTEAGLAAPTLGWRSWNAFKGEIDETKLKAQVDALVAPGPSGPSLFERGYTDVGMDDGYMQCKGMTKIHDEAGNYKINMTRFPDMLGLTTYAHNQGVSMGFYTNNCMCPETLFNRGANTTYQQDVDFAIANGFAGVKVDGCGPNDQIHLWSEAVSKSTVKNPLAPLKANAPKLAIENCGDNPNRPKGMPMTWSIPTRADVTGDNCTFDTYRVSKDIAPEFYSAMNNLQHISTFTDSRLGEQLSRPGCWAYGDMLQVGYMNTTDQDKSHFGAWAIASSPLILGYDLSNKTLMNNAYDIVSNPLAIKINQAYYGDAGHVAANGTTYFEHYAAHSMDVDPFCNAMQQCTMESFPDHQIWVKALGEDKAAVLVINMLNTTSTVGYWMHETTGIPAGKPLYMNDVWAFGSKSQGVPVDASGAVKVTLAPYASQFLVVSATQTSDEQVLAEL